MISILVKLKDEKVLLIYDKRISVSRIFCWRVFSFFGVLIEVRMVVMVFDHRGGWGANEVKIQPTSHSQKRSSGRRLVG